jgi:hypothetical protein
VLDRAVVAVVVDERCGVRAGEDVDDLGDDDARDMATYIRPPITSTARFQRVNASGTAQTSRHASMRTRADKPCGHRPYKAFRKRSQGVPQPSPGVTISPIAESTGLTSRLSTTRPAADNPTIMGASGWVFLLITIGGVVGTVVSYTTAAAGGYYHIYWGRRRFGLIAFVRSIAPSLGSPGVAHGSRTGSKCERCPRWMASTPSGRPYAEHLCQSCVHGA